ncbi:hypothetical protein B484DRAFT_437253, partial [Ochromonadaceae sp. CCMP2298]
MEERIRTLKATGMMVIETEEGMVDKFLLRNGARKVHLGEMLDYLRKEHFASQRAVIRRKIEAESVFGESHAADLLRDAFDGDRKKQAVEKRFRAAQEQRAQKQEQTLALVQQGSGKGKGMGSGTGQGQGMGLEGEGQSASGLFVALFAAPEPLSSTSSASISFTSPGTSSSSPSARSSKPASKRPQGPTRPSPLQPQVGPAPVEYFSKKGTRMLALVKARVESGVELTNDAKILYTVPLVT